jgi:2-succinyl-5-enolpyruvyl-6-hydroxy-3-cyclohexene-1-carboxylate synthase
MSGSSRVTGPAGALVGRAAGMSKPADDLHSAWAQLFVASLKACGVAQAVISPGSRSTPLALALAAQLPTSVLHDERVAAFFALGQARVSGRPSVVLATSGTAPGHWLPAVMEARESCVPLLLVSADRPWELQEAQASQTVDQLRLFGNHARAFFELGLPDSHPAALRALPRIAAQAVLATRYPLPGAVQVNARFRKPLEPQPSDGREPWRERLVSIARAGAPRLIEPQHTPHPDAVRLLVERVRAAPRGVVVAGPVPVPEGPALRQAIARFLAASGYVLLAEATSQLRFGLDDATMPGCIGAFDALLREPTLRQRLRPDLAIELGAPAVSAQWQAWAESDGAPARIALPGARPADPAGGAVAMLLGPVTALLDAAAAQLGSWHRTAPESALQYARHWRNAEAAAWSARHVSAARPAMTALHELDIAPLVRAALPTGAMLAIGNSSPVRDLDHDAPPDRVPLGVLHQRGAAGIDGLVAGAAGARSVTDVPIALLLGDVSLLHDAGGLAAAAVASGALAIVVVHNDGGRIFERLPSGSEAQVTGLHERLFVAPHGCAFDGLAASWGLGYARVDTPEALSEALVRALAADRAVLIEARVVSGGSARRATVLAAMAAAGAAELAERT